MRTTNEHFASDSARDTLGHWILLGDYEAEAFVNWLMNDSGLSDNEVIQELEYQRSRFDVSTYFQELCTNAINTVSEGLYNMPVRCSQCGRIILYGEAKYITTGYKTNRTSQVVSRSLVGGSTVRRISETYTPNERCFCEKCANEYYKKCKEDAENSGIKGFFRKLFG
jgi:hypothetical protein